VVGWSVSNKLEKIWKEQLWTNLGYSPGCYLDQLRKAMNPSIRLAGVPFNIQNCHLSDTHQKCLLFEPSLLSSVLDSC
jgi:hypothetical protein